MQVYYARNTRERSLSFITYNITSDHKESMLL